MQTKKITRNTAFPDYMIFPKFLIDLKISETSKILYAILLDRTRLSRKSPQWQDENGDIYIYYRIDNLVTRLHKGKTAVENSLTLLEENNLIQRKRQGVGRPNRIYVKIPFSAEGQSDVFHHMGVHDCDTEKVGFVGAKGSELCYWEEQEPGLQSTGNVSTIKNKKNKNKGAKNKGSKDRTCYGRYDNVFLSEQELDMIQAEIPEWKDYVEHLSEYMQSKGVAYSDHAATIFDWARKDHKILKKKDYSYREGQSL